MGQLRELEAAALGRNSRLEDIVKTALQVADQLNDREASRWLNEELHGYAFVDRVPDYRRVVGEAGMTIAHAWQNFTWRSAKQARLLSVWPLDQRVAYLEKAAGEVVAILKPLDYKELQPHVIESIPLTVLPQLRVPVASIHEVLTKLRRRIYEWAASKTVAEPITSDDKVTGRNWRGDTVFIVHGHDHTVRDRIDLFLTKDLGLQTSVLEAGAMRGLTLPEKFESIARDAGFAVFILTGDDLLSINGKNVRRARQNVILEIGYFWALLGRRDRVAFLIEDHPEMELRSDVQGIGWIPITSDLADTKRKLAAELAAAGVVTTT